MIQFNPSLWALAQVQPPKGKPKPTPTAPPIRTKAGITISLADSKFTIQGTNADDYVKLQRGENGQPQLVTGNLIRDEEDPHTLARDPHTDKPILKNLEIIDLARLGFNEKGYWTLDIKMDDRKYEGLPWSEALKAYEANRYDHVIIESLNFDRVYIRGGLGRNIARLNSVITDEIHMSGGEAGDYFDLRRCTILVHGIQINTGRGTDHVSLYITKSVGDIEIDVGDQTLETKETVNLTYVETKGKIEIKGSEETSLVDVTQRIE